MEESHPLPIDYNAAHLSGILQKFLKDIDSKTANQIVFLICEVQKPTMKIVFEWMQHHKNDPLQKEIKFTGHLNMLTFHRSKKRTKLSNWDKEYFKRNHHKICDIMKAAKILKIPGLYNMAAQSIADLLCLPVPAIKREFLLPQSKKSTHSYPSIGHLVAHTLERLRFLNSTSRNTSR